MNTHSIQKHTYAGNNGFVLHKITGSFSGRCSAWYDVSGKLLDAEQITNRGARQVQPHAAIWQYLQEVGTKFAR